MKNSIKATIAAAALAAALTGCSTSGEPAGPQTGAQPTTAAPAASPAASTPAFEAEKSTAQFGEAWAYDNGLGVKVDLVGPATASQYAAGAEATAGQMFVFDVAVTNGTAEPFDPALLTINVNYGAAGSPAMRVFDTEAGIGDHFQGTILPGGTQTVRVGFAMPTDAPQEVVFEVSPDFVHDSAIFFGTAAP